MVVESRFRRQVGDKIFVVHYTVEAVHSCADELSHCGVSHTRTSEIVYIYRNSKLLAQSESSNFG